MKRMARFGALLLALAVLLHGAGAEALYRPESDDTAYGYFPDCICAGDEGLAAKAVIEKLKEKGFLSKYHPAECFDDAVETAVMAFQRTWGLEETGRLDNVSLTQLLTGGEVFEADVWVPVHGGKKYHLTAECSNMREPKQVSRTNAREMKYEPCKRCYSLAAASD